jgi:putative transposase
MPKPIALDEISLTEIERVILINIINKRTNPAFLVKRAQIIYYADQSYTNTFISDYLKVDMKTVQLWRKRWKFYLNQLAKIEKESDFEKELEKLIIEILSDKPRPGSPKKFTDLQHAQIIALACQNPQEIGLPFSNWTISELLKEAINRKIVESISWTKVQNFLKYSGFKTPSNEILA